jgi:predicted RNA-binding protein with PIN domain
MAYLIDGHNLIPHVRGLSLSDLDDEAALIELLKQFGQQRQKNIEVYFDGAPPGFARQRRFGRVTAHFVPRASSADAAIEQRLVALGRGAKNYVVVTSDHRVERSAREAHAQVISSQAFADELHALSSSPPSAADSAGGMGSIDEWLEIFKRGHPPGDKP